MRALNVWTVKTGALLACGLALALVGGCARGGETTPTGPSVVVDFLVQMKAAVNEAYYYFIPIDTDGDLGVDGPIPVAAGPYWGNGWGTGSFTHFVMYHLGQYELYRVNLDPALRTAGGGITAVSGTPASTDAGTHTVTVDTLTYGAVAVSGTGMISAVTNNSFQSAGTLALATNGAGQVVAGSVTFAPATDGGRSLTASEQANLDTLNAGGVALANDSLAGLGLTLTLGAAQAGSQILAVSATTATATDVFESAATGDRTTSACSLRANSTTPTSDPPVPGLTVTTRDLVPAGTAVIALTLSPVATLIGPPYDYTLPAGGNTLRVTVDLDALGTNLTDLSVNMINTNELIFDPTITDPTLHSYDGLGATGNRYVSFRTTQYQTINNASGLFEQEQAGDSTLIGPTSQAQRDSLDIVDWSITIRRLR